ncbi:MAG TPA: division/cell wall cluster transcriptional repressor MraZ [Dongiaceae bacterium]|nr:division/cell wall cluster transcriptional repressor MraZ [Dongiaceae bacterium]
MALFLGTFLNRIDRKGRISVPASFRSALNLQGFQGIAAFPAFRHQSIQCAGLDWIQGLSDRIARIDLFSDEQDDLAATLFADAHQLAFDSEGRIILPESLRQHAGIDEAVAFVGLGPRFEIWEPGRWEDHKKQARNRAREQGLTLRQGAAE